MKAKTKQSMTLFIYTRKSNCQQKWHWLYINNLHYNYINIQKHLGNGSDWIFDSVIEHDINISKYNLLAVSSYTKLWKELDHPRKGLINIQNNDDNECLKWCIVRYLHSANHNPSRITKANKHFEKRFDFKDTKFPVKIRDNHKI